MAKTINIQAATGLDTGAMYMGQLKELVGAYERILVKCDGEAGAKLETVVGVLKAHIADRLTARGNFDKPEVIAAFERVIAGVVLTSAPSVRLARARNAAERLAEVNAYSVYVLSDTIARAEENAKRAKTREACLRLRRLSDALDAIMARGEDEAVNS